MSSENINKASHGCGKMMKSFDSDDLVKCGSYNKEDDYFRRCRNCSRSVQEASP